MAADPSILAALEQVRLATLEAAQALIAGGGIQHTAKEDTVLRPAVLAALRARGLQASDKPTRLSTSVRSHPFDIVWENADGVRGALEIKLKKRARNHPADDSRLFFWYDLKWLELGLQAGAVHCGAAALLTDVPGLHTPSGRGDSRHSHYSIAHDRPHRCDPAGPDHLFTHRYKPGTQFLPELHPLRLDNCYDFRGKWTVFDAAQLLFVPVCPPSSS